MPLKSFDFCFHAAEGHRNCTTFLSSVRGSTVIIQVEHGAIRLLRPSFPISFVRDQLAAPSFPRIADKTSWIHVVSRAHRTCNWFLSDRFFFSSMLPPFHALCLRPLPRSSRRRVFRNSVPPVEGIINTIGGQLDRGGSFEINLKHAVGAGAMCTDTIRSWHVVSASGEITFVAVFWNFRKRRREI